MTKQLAEKSIRGCLRQLPLHMHSSFLVSLLYKNPSERALLLLPKYNLTVDEIREVAAELLEKEL